MPDTKNSGGFAVSADSPDDRIQEVYVEIESLRDRLLAAEQEIVVLQKAAIRFLELTP